MRDLRMPASITPAKFAKLMKAWRDRNGFSQNDAAKELGINKRTLENWEQERATPRGYGLNALVLIFAEPKPTKQVTKKTASS